MMKIITFIFTLAILLFNDCKPVSVQKAYTEDDILKQLDLAFRGVPNDFYPPGNSGDIKYNFMLDLEHGYCVTAGSRIHLYADKNRWAIVFEKSGYQNRAGDAEIELDYFGNCINYPVDKYPERNYITNTSNIVLISGGEYERIRNKKGSDYEQFELISPLANEVNIRGKKVKIEHDLSKYARLGIIPRSDDNPKKLIGFGDIVRYLSETAPSTIAATDAEIREHIPANIPKLMTIGKFHFESVYKPGNLPSTQETYQLLAKILVKRDTSLWKPTLKPTNHWSNWTSGNL
ncbi:DUF7003 family protein [Mucilaginibacter gotjawali]|uniref:Uncharacterized protein n=1 Tax=Mucilaginibacter gotjawali TaxID=1550579 RepID=A0A839SD40_9SPHI|nr:hypothetical protein [Mucilaginibacter gotjawali]MBB3054589.1 hypothetical protein [Mucilaginibacter gotjawali]